MASKSKNVGIREADVNSKSTSAPDDFTKNYSDFSKKLVCIRYPGRVKNTDKMFETIGGIQTIERTVGHPRRNLELRFRPDDLYCKPCVSERSTKPNILLKIKLRNQIASNGSEGSEVECKPEIVSYEIMGLSAVTFTFNKLCDFQYLPLTAIPKGGTCDFKLEYVHDRIFPKQLPDLKWFENEDTRSMPFFFPPGNFSKSDITAANLHFNRSAFYAGRFRSNVAEKFRQQECNRKVFVQNQQDSTRAKNVIICRIDDVIPDQPNETIRNNFQSKVNMINGLREALNNIKKFFADRPIASRLCLHYHMQYNNEHYKILLPCVTFYYVNGPWRMMWVRYGYDPRKDATSRMYQSLDFRVRSVIGLKRYITAKRTFTRKTDSHESASYNAEPQPSTSAQSVLQAINEPAFHKSHPCKTGVSEDTFMLRPGVLPSCRQLMYQYCDVQLPDIQAMLSRLPVILPGTRCDPKNGWLPPGFHDQCREIITKYIDSEINRALEKQRAMAVASAMDEGDGGTVAKQGILHEISSDDSSSSDELSSDDDRENGVRVDEDLLDEIDKLIDVKENTPTQQ